MAKMVITEYERHVAGIVEYALHTLPHTDLSVAEIIEAAHQNGRFKSQNAPLCNDRRKQRVLLRASHRLCERE